jgi:O-antigen/teichoic acid export membrane protein
MLENLLLATAIPNLTLRAPLLMLTTAPLTPLTTEAQKQDEVAAITVARPSVLTSRMLLSIVDQCIVSGTNFLTIVVLGRACGLSELGVYSLAYTIVVILLVVQESLLVTPYTVIASHLRSAARRRHYAAATLEQQLFVACVASVGLFVAAACVGWLIPGGAFTAVIAMLAVVTPCWLLKEFARRICFVELNTRVPIVLDTIAAAVQLSVLCALWAGVGVSASLALAAAGLGHASAATIWCILFRPSLHTPRHVFRRAVRLNWGLGSWTSLSRITEMLHTYSLHWLLALVAGPAATGAYAAALSLLALANPMIMGVGNLLAPETARAYAGGGIAALRRMVLRVSGQVTLITGAFVLLLAASAGPLLGLIFGEVEPGQATVVVVLSLGLWVGMAGFGADNGLRALARPVGNFRADLLGWGISVAFAAVLIGSWGAPGAAVGALAGNIAATVVRIGVFAQIVRERSAAAPAIAYSVQG